MVCNDSTGIRLIVFGIFEVFLVYSAFLQFKIKKDNTLNATRDITAVKAVRKHRRQSSSGQHTYKPDKAKLLVF